MILYLDTSALIKLYVDEEGSGVVRKYVELASVIATSKIAFIEARSAFARAKREKMLSGESYRRIVERLYYDWERYMKVEISDGLIIVAGELTENFGLRGFDAIHHASVLFLQGQTGDIVVAACWDFRLWHALKKTGLKTIPEKNPGDS